MANGAPLEGTPAGVGISGVVLRSVGRGQLAAFPLHGSLASVCRVVRCSRSERIEAQ